MSAARKARQALLAGLSSAFIKPGSVTLAAGWAASSGTALSCITGAGKEVEQPTEPSTTQSIEGTGAPNTNATVKPETPAELKAALEAGRKLLSLTAWVYVKQGASKRTVVTIARGAEQLSAELEVEGIPAIWVSRSLTSAQAEAVTTLAHWEEIALVISHRTSSTSKVHEVYFLATWQPAANKDAMSGTVVSSGSIVQAYKAVDTAAGTVTAVGTEGDAERYTDARNATVTASGSALDAAVGSDPRSGGCTASGTVSEALTLSEGRSGGATSSGSAADALRYTDTVEGFTGSAGTNAERALLSDTAAGTVTATGSSFESWSTSSHASDHMNAIVTASGKPADSYSASDEAFGVAGAFGAPTDSAIYTDATAGGVLAGGAALDRASGSDAGNGVVTSTGQGSDMVGYFDVAFGTVTASGTGVETDVGARTGHLVIKSLAAGSVKVTSLRAARLVITTPED